MCDTSLVSCWDMAKVNKKNFVIDQGLLYHVDQVKGEKVCQLCSVRYASCNDADGA